jgi:hypothetical protein
VIAIAPPTKQAYPFLGGSELLSLNALLLVSHFVIFMGVINGCGVVVLEGKRMENGQLSPFAARATSDVWQA